MAKQSVVEMLKKPISLRPVSGAQESAALISELYALLQRKDEEIRALHETIAWLRKQYEGSSRRELEIPEFTFEIAARDMNGAIKSVTAKPRNV